MQAGLCGLGFGREAQRRAFGPSGPQRGSVIVQFAVRCLIVLAILCFCALWSAARHLTSPPLSVILVLTWTFFLFVCFIGCCSSSLCCSSGGLCACRGSVPLQCCSDETCNLIAVLAIFGAMSGVSAVFLVLGAHFNVPVLKEIGVGGVSALILSITVAIPDDCNHKKKWTVIISVILLPVSAVPTVLGCVYDVPAIYGTGFAVIQGCVWAVLCIYLPDFSKKSGLCANCSKKNVQIAPAPQSPAPQSPVHPAASVIINLPQSSST